MLNRVCNVWTITLFYLNPDQTASRCYNRYVSANGVNIDSECSWEQSDQSLQYLSFHYKLIESLSMDPFKIQEKYGEVSMGESFRDYS